MGINTRLRSLSIILASVTTFSLVAGSFPTVPTGLYFIENEGQYKSAGEKIFFKAEGAGTNLFITEKGLSYVFTRQNGPFSSDTSTLSYSRFDIELKNGSLKKEHILKEDAADHTFTFIDPFSPTGTTANLYRKIAFLEVYKGIDWILYFSKQDGLKYDFVIHAGADPSEIALLYRSLNKPFIENGEVKLDLAIGNFSDKAPECFSDGQLVKSNYLIKRQEKRTIRKNTFYETEIGFSVSHFDRKETLIIDPLQLWWGTYYGGTNGSEGTSITTDASGNVFLLGNTNSIDIPTLQYDTICYFQGTYGGAVNGGGLGDAFILKFTNTGQLLWATYFGGSAVDKGTDIKCDKNGNVFATGYTYSTDFPVKNPGGGAYFAGTNSSTNWIQEVFISKFDNNGKYLWGTYYGSPDVETVGGLTIDAFGNVCVTGATNSANFPTYNPGGGAFFQGTFGGGMFSQNDTFILKFSNSGVLQLATYFGGSGTDIPTGAASDPTGNVFIYGYSNSTNLFTLDPGNGAYYQDSLKGSGYNSFILKLNTTSQPTWATYLGGSNGAHFTSGIACDSLGNLFVTGTSTALDFPTVNPGGGAFYEPTNSGNVVFICKFNSQDSMTWSTLFGQVGGYGTNTIEITSGKCQGIYISFPTFQWTFDTLQVMNPGNGIYYDGTYAGSTYDDIFLASFTNTGKQTWGSFFGGVGHEVTMPLTIDKNGSLFYTGQQGSVNYWTASDFSSYTSGCIVNPGNGAYFQPLPLNAPGIGGYCVVGKFLNQNMNLIASVTGCLGTDSAVITPTGGFSPYTYNWSNGSSSSIITNVAPGTYTCTITDQFGCSEIETVEFGPPGLSVTVPSATLCAGQSVALTAQGATTYSWIPSTGLSSTSTSSVSASPNTNISYTVIGYSSMNCTDSGVVSVSVNPLPIITITGNDSICGEDSSLLTASGANTYSWIPTIDLSAASGVSVIASPPQTQIYTAIGQDAKGCIDSSHFTLNVFSLAQLQVNGSLSYCIGQNTLLAASGADTYLWSPASGLSATSGTVVTASSFSTATFTLTGSLAGMCKDSVSFTITVFPLPGISVSAPDSACKGQETQLNAIGNGTINWAPAGLLSCNQCPNPIATIQNNTQFVAIITDSNMCTNKDSLILSLINGCGENIIIPNIFTPNGDGINDLFLIKADRIRSFSCVIYNRWGVKIFESDNPNISWDGRTTAGLECVEGTYYYIINISKYSQQKKEFKGFLSLIK